MTKSNTVLDLYLVTCYVWIMTTLPNLTIMIVAAYFVHMFALLLTKIYNLNIDTVMAYDLVVGISIIMTRIFLVDNLQI